MSHSVQIVKHTEALGYVILDYINTIDLTFDFMHHLKFVNVSYHPKHLSGGSQLLYCQMELISLATECHSSTVSPSLLVHPLNKASCPAGYWVSEWVSDGHLFHFSLAELKKKRPIPLPAIASCEWVVRVGAVPGPANSAVCLSQILRTLSPSRETYCSSKVWLEGSTWWIDRGQVSRNG